MTRTQLPGEVFGCGSRGKSIGGSWPDVAFVRELMMLEALRQRARAGMYSWAQEQLLSNIRKMRELPLLQPQNVTVTPRDACH